MKKTTALLLSLICLCALVGCTAKPEVKIDYGASALYSKEEMDAAIEIIKSEFSTWDGCELHRIYYVSDDACNPETVAWMNELKAPDDTTAPFTQCILFQSDFHSPKNGGGAWNADQEYTAWQWWLARTDGGRWQ